MILEEYVTDHIEIVPFKCHPGGHTVDVVRFKITGRNEPEAPTLRSLIKRHHGSGQCAPLDGQPHNYQEIGTWLGDQDLALQLMALGQIVGIWRVYAFESGDVMIIACSGARSHRLARTIENSARSFTSSGTAVGMLNSK